MEKQDGSQNDMTVYEVSYLLLPTISVEQIPAKVAILKDMVSSYGGEIISDENPVLIDLAYSMTKVFTTTRHKVSSGYFGWVKFEIGTEAIDKIKKGLDANGEVVRYLIVKTVRENTLLNGKMKLVKEDKTKREEVVDEVLEIPEIEKEVVAEELDKSIDDLVIA